jgi:hypothetical protein
MVSVTGLYSPPGENSGWRLWGIGKNANAATLMLCVVCCRLCGHRALEDEQHRKQQSSGKFRCVHPRNLRVKSPDLKMVDDNSDFTTYFAGQSTVLPHSPWFPHELRPPRHHLPLLVPLHISPRRVGIVREHRQPLFRDRSRVILLLALDRLHGK